MPPVSKPIATQPGLMTDGIFHGLLDSCSGGYIHGEVVHEKASTPLYLAKRISGLVYDPVTMLLPSQTVKSPALAEWIRSSFERGAVLKSASVVACDTNGTVVNSRDFYDAFISEVTFPALDGNSTSKASILVQLDPDVIRYQKGSGGRVSIAKDGKMGVMAADFMAANFRFELGNLPCSKVFSVSPLTWKQDMLEPAAADHQFTKRLSASTIAVSNIKVSISLADLDPWWDWFETFLIDGQITEEYDGSIELLSNDQTHTLARIDLRNVGIVGLEIDQTQASSGAVSRFTAELYIERIALDLS